MLMESRAWPVSGHYRPTGSDNRAGDHLMTSVQAAGVMHATLGGVPIALRVEDAETFKSPHTGRELQRLRVAAEVSRDAAAVFDEPVEDRPRVIGLDDSRWRIVDSAWSYGSGILVAHVQATLEMEEALQPSAVQISDRMLLVPTRYSEEYEEGAIVVTMRIVLDREATQEFHEFEGSQWDDETEDRSYFPVTSVGLRENPIEMRFGRVLWRKVRGTDQTEFGFALVERPWDQVEHSNVFASIGQPELQRVREVAAQTSEGFSMLLEALTRSGAVSAADAAAIHTAMGTAARRRAYEFRRADDLDEFGL